MKSWAFAAKAAIVALFAFHFSLFVSTSTAYAVEVDGVAATVGTDSILRSDVLNEIARAGTSEPPEYADVLNRMIERKLILKAAQESKMTIQAWVVENRVREIVNRSFGGDRNKLIEALGKQQISYPEWYAKTKEDIVIGAMRWNVIDKNVTASPSAMRKEYEANAARYVKDHLVSVTVILLQPEEKAKREEISAALKDKSFEDLGGKKYENVKPEELFKPEVCAEIDKMPKGTISHWIEIDGWSFLLRKDAESTGSKLSFDEAYDQIEADVKEKEAKRLYTAWLDRLRAETYIKVY